MSGGGGGSGNDGCGGGDAIVAVVIVLLLLLFLVTLDVCNGSDIRGSQKDRCWWPIRRYPPTAREGYPIRSDMRLSLSLSIPGY